MQLKRALSEQRQIREKLMEKGGGESSGEEEATEEEGEEGEPGTQPEPEPEPFEVSKCSQEDDVFIFTKHALCLL